MNTEKRTEIERRLVRHLVRTMKAAGWKADRVDDGGDADERVGTETEVLDAVFAVDEARIRFSKDGIKHWALIVLGNDGWDCISDYSYSEDDDFGSVMKTDIDPYVSKLEHEFP